MRWSFPASAIPSAASGHTRVRMMTDAILIAVREIQDVHGRGPIDALAVSLSSEFLARAVTETPLAFRSVALVSPTGFRSRDENAKWRDGTRAMPWLHALFEFPLWSEGFFRLLTSRAGIRYFLQQDLGLARYRRGPARIRLPDHASARRPARAVLFRVGISVQRGHHPDLSFADLAGVDGARRPRRFRRLHQQDRGRRIAPTGPSRCFQTGAMPHFEAKAAFIAAYDAFLAGAPAAPSA